MTTTAAVRLLSGEREPVRVATTTDITLYGLQAVDGLALAVNDRVLVKDQTDARENGIYTASTGRWYRASDASFSRAISAGVTVQVREGSTNGGKAFRFATPEPDIGSDEIAVEFYLSATFVADARAAIEEETDRIEGVLQGIGDLTGNPFNDYDNTAIASADTIPELKRWVRTAGELASGDGGGGLYTRAASEPATGRKFRSTDRFLPGGGTSAENGGWWQLVNSNKGKPIVILATGQSNVAIEEPLTWTPPPNLYEWNWNGIDETTVGTAFAPPSGSVMSVGLSLAAEVAKASPGSDVYIISIGRGEQSIGKWMAGATTPKMYDAVKLNVEAALVQLAPLGASEIDALLWWQGETDVMNGSTTYVADFNAVMARFDAETWFPRSVQTVIVGPSPIYASGQFLRFYATLRRAVSFDRKRRIFASLEDIEAAYWMPPTGIHMTGEGYREAGRVAHHALMRGAGQAAEATPWLHRVSTALSSVPSSTLQFDHPELQMYVRAGFSRLRFRVVGQSPAVAGFKWSIVGPAANIVAWKAKYVGAGDPAVTKETAGSGSSYPSNQTTGASGNFHLEIDLFLNLAAAGMIKFQFGQETANATAANVFALSEVELLEA